jgi:hypothetical protein
VQHFKPPKAVASVAETQEAPKNRYEKLENRISACTMASSYGHAGHFTSSDELEAMLRDKDSFAANTSQSTLSSSSAQSQGPSLLAYSGAANPLTPPSSFHSSNLGLPQCYQSSAVFAGVAPSTKRFIPPVDTHADAINISATTSPHSGVPADAPFLSHGLGYDVFWPGWPRDLPSPGLVRHL